MLKAVESSLTLEKRKNVTKSEDRHASGHCCQNIYISVHFFFGGERVRCLFQQMWSGSRAIMYLKYVTLPLVDTSRSCLAALVNIQHSINLRLSHRKKQQAQCLRSGNVKHVYALVLQLLCRGRNSEDIYDSTW